MILMNEIGKIKIESDCPLKKPQDHTSFTRITIEYQNMRFGPESWLRTYT